MINFAFENLKIPLMKISIEVKGENSQKQVLHLKKYLEKARIDELGSVKVNRVTAKKGEMGAGVISTLTAVLIGISGPFSRFAQAFTTYAAGYKTEIILKNEYGDELILNTKKLDKEGINYLVDKFLEKKTSAPKRRKTTKSK